MKTLQRLGVLALLGTLVAATAAPVQAQAIGSTLVADELEGFSQTEASSFDDLFGRAVLVEFFAYW